MRFYIYQGLYRQELPRQLGGPGQNGLYGGLFVNRVQAVKYALFENGHHPETIVELSREIELDMDGKLPSSDRLSTANTRRGA